jgi:two-component system, OmpR family, sensor histidine kinase MtrB
MSRMGVRGRVNAAFALGSLAVSLLLAVTTFAIASSYLLEQRHQSALRQTVFHARVVAGALATGQPATQGLLDRVDTTTGTASMPLLLFDGRWYDDRLPGGHQVLPEAFREAAAAGHPVSQRVDLGSGLRLVLAVPIEGAAATYVEVFDVEELDRTLTALTAIFAGTATATTVLGLLLGRWASRRALRPLHAVASAAAAVAGGDLNARLEVKGDPELVALATAFNDTTARLRERVQRDARFAGNVSHELRSPLTTIVNAADLLADRTRRLPPETREVAEMLTAEVHRLARTVEDLLEISRPDSATALRRERLHAATLTRLVADRCAGRAVTVVEAGAQELVCVGDKRRLEQVLVNLVTNAAQHGGGVDTVRVERGEGVVRIAVEDHGPGVPPEERDEIFERFARGHPTAGRAPDGAGLGLALVREHVHAHAGRVWVEPRPRGGARFVVELPTVQPVG